MIWLLTLAALSQCGGGQRANRHDSFVHRLFGHWIGPAVYSRTATLSGASPSFKRLYDVNNRGSLLCEVSYSLGFESLC